jgi:L-seryl-tRNA(Ser) seleniumtransferase
VDKVKVKRFDRFNNPIDPAVGYARGRILQGPAHDVLRMNHAREIMSFRLHQSPPLPLFNFTGLRRDFLLKTADLTDGLTEEWSGPAHFWPELERLAKEHMGGKSDHTVAIFNRCSSGIIATILALVSPDDIVLSVVPKGISHPSILRGVELARAQMIEVQESFSVQEAVRNKKVALAILTGVTSELDILSLQGFEHTIDFCKLNHIPILIDDAYGSRLRPVLKGQPKTCEFDVELGITSCDKAGMSGPRSGLLVGKSSYIDKVLSWANQMGLEARPPLALGVLRSLQHYTPDQLKAEIALGADLHKLLSQKYEPIRVRKVAIGASISEEDILEISAERANIMANETILVPAEVSCALGMILLRDWGIITTNAAAQTGARISLRLKPDNREVERFGDIESVVEVIDKAFDEVSKLLIDPKSTSNVIFGNAA